MHQPGQVKFFGRLDDFSLYTKFLQIYGKTVRVYFAFLQQLKKPNFFLLALQPASHFLSLVPAAEANETKALLYFDFI
jgi:hypothetical protein